MTDNTVTQDDDAVQPAWRDVADHVLQMQEKYGFCADVDGIRDAVDDSANLLRIELSEEDAIKACYFIEEANEENVEEEELDEEE